MTCQYNETMKKVFPRYGIILTEIERKQSPNGVISASRVREAITSDNLPLLEEMLPATTLAFLRSGEADDIRIKLKTCVKSAC